MAASLRGVRNLFTISVRQKCFSTPPTVTACCIQGYEGAFVASIRHASFFNRLSADKLWGGVAGVSNAGRKKGRGKKLGNKKNTDLNRGQIIGDAKSGMLWPGLNAPVLKGREVVRQQQLEPDPERQKQLLEIRNKFNQNFRSMRLTPLQRGWSGSRYPGQSVGPPDSIDDYQFHGFDTRVLEFKVVANMTGNLGRKHQFSAFVVTGNGKGLAGYGLGKAPNARAAIRKAKKRAGQQLQYFSLLEDRTIWQDFHSKLWYTAIFFERKEEGYGLRSHRALKTICEVIGIKDMRAKVDTRSKNIQNMTKAFFAGLQKMQTHHELAARHGLHVVELRQERDLLPVVMASPPDGGAALDTAGATEGGGQADLDYDRLGYGGRVPLVRPPWQPFYHNLKPYKEKQKRLYTARNQRQRQIERWARS